MPPLWEIRCRVGKGPPHFFPILKAYCVEQYFLPGCHDCCSGSVSRPSGSKKYSPQDNIQAVHCLNSLNSNECTPVPSSLPREVRVPDLFHHLAAKPAPNDWMRVWRTLLDCYCEHWHANNNSPGTKVQTEGVLLRCVANCRKQPSPFNIWDPNIGEGRDGASDPGTFPRGLQLHG
jgi:hypothetical protein